MMKKEQNLNTAETQALNIPVVNGSALTEEDMIEQANQEEYLHNLQCEENMNKLYDYGDDGFCDGFTKI